MAHSGVTVEDKCIDIFNELKLFKVGKTMQYRYMRMKLNDKMTEIVLDETPPRETTFDEMIAALPPNDCRWVRIFHSLS